MAMPRVPELLCLLEVLTFFVFVFLFYCQCQRDANSASLTLGYNEFPTAGNNRVSTSIRAHRNHRVTPGSIIQR